METFSLGIPIKDKGVGKKLLEVYNPSIQSLCAHYPKRCVAGKAPTLTQVNNNYGSQVAIDWLVIEINDYQNFVGVKEDNKATKEVVVGLSKMIINRYYYLKLSELMLFFQKLKYGDYGEMYGCVDAVRILRALSTFVKDRNAIIDSVKSDEEKAKCEEIRKNAISYEEYLALKRKEGGRDDDKGTTSIRDTKPL